MAVGAGILVVAVWVATLLMPSQQPLTVEAATAKVTGYLDRIEGTLPADSVLERSEEVTRSACPLEERGDQAKIRRVVYVDPELDRVSWAAALSGEFPEADGWVVRVDTLDSRENLGIRIVGQDLIVINVTASDASGRARITMRSTSECSQPS
jgi:hypothetical protein